MADIHEGGCVCGAVRFRVNGAPLLAQLCHCTFCQRRTGSAFAPVVTFRKDEVESSGDTLTEYEHRSDESGHWVRYQFCSRCGTTVFLTLEAFPAVRVIAGGTLDDPSWFRIKQHTWTRSARHWMEFPADAKRYEKGFAK
jgi:hypothetical protein